jgi:hypothetical protein
MARSVIPALLVMCGALASRAEEIVLRDEAGKAKVVAVSHPRYPGRYIVAWDNLPIERSSGAALFKKEEPSRGVRFVPVGWVGPFALTNDGRKTVVGGSLVPLYYLAYSAKEPITLILSSESAGDPDKVMTRYRRTEHFPIGKESRKQVEPQLLKGAQALNAACKGRLSVWVNWPTFTGANAGLPLAALAVLQGMQKLCADPDYQKEISKLTTLQVKLNNKTDEEDDFRLEHVGSDLIVYLRDDTANPTARTTKWLVDQL